MKVLVTGGTGFLGLYIVERLLARGDAVRVLARHRAGGAVLRDVEFCEADIRDREKTVEACRGVDAVIHTAAKEGVEPSRALFFETNFEGTRNILDGCRRHGVYRLVATSSPSVIDGGTPLEGVDETIPYPKRSLSFYAASKRAAEEQVLRANSNALLTCAIRPRLLWGPRDRQLIPRMIAKAKSGQLRRIGTGTNLLDITYVENAADAHILALNALTPGSPVPGNAYFISQGCPVNCWDWIDRVLEMAGCPAVRKRISFGTAYTLGTFYENFYRVFKRGCEPPITRFLATQLAFSYWFDISKARRDLNYEPKVTTEEGIQRLREWLTP